jgi:hypothetical protein
MDDPKAKFEEARAAAAVVSPDTPYGAILTIFPASGKRPAALTARCEHSQIDFEQCPDCRARSRVLDALTEKEGK